MRTHQATVLAILWVIAGRISADAIRRRWVCHSMACTEGEHFCSSRTRRCERCEDYIADCAKPLQAHNCTEYCMDIAVTKEVDIRMENERIADCPALDPIQHGSHNATQAQRHLAVVAFSCARGYKSSATVREVECMDYGMWSGQPKCHAIVCPAPTGPENGYIGPDMQEVDEKAQRGGYEESYPLGQTMIVQCDKGFNLAGRNTTTCGEDGHWDLNKIPPCYPSKPPGIPIPGWIILISVCIYVFVFLSVMLYITIYMYCTKGIRNTGNHMYERVDMYGSKDSETADKQLHQDELTGDANDQRNASETAHSWEDETIGMERPIPAHRTRTTHTDTTPGQTGTEQPTGPQPNTQGLTFTTNINLSVAGPTVTTTATSNATANEYANRTRHSNPTAKVNDNHTDRPEHEYPLSTEEVGDAKPHTGTVPTWSDYQSEGFHVARGQPPVSELHGTNVIYDQCSTLLDSSLLK